MAHVNYLICLTSEPREPHFARMRTRPNFSTYRLTTTCVEVSRIRAVCASENFAQKNCTRVKPGLVVIRMGE